MYICDCHCDTLMHFPNRPSLSLYENDLHIDIHRQLAIGGGLQFYAIYIPTEEVQRHNSAHYLLQCMDYYYRELEALGERGIRIKEIKTVADVQQAKDYDSAALLAIEDGSAFEGSIELLRMAYRLGVRATTLTWNPQNELGTGIGEEDSKGGLTRFGRQAITEMNRLGMIVDISHSAPQTFWDALEVSTKPIMATHANAKACCSHPRNLTDKQIKSLVEQGGIMGLTFAGQFLDEDWHDASIDSVCRHIDHILQLLGTDEYLAIGSDFDGISHPPRDIRGIEDLPALYDRLRLQYGEVTADRIFHQNVLRFLQTVL